MRFARLICPVCLVFAATTAHAESSGRTSWGKAGVSLSQYAHDANACAATSRTVAVSIKPETLQKLDGMSSAALLDIAMQASPSPVFDPMAFANAIGSQKSENDVARRTNTFGAKYVAMVRPDVKDELQEILDKCLRERGYTRIRLTAEQQKTLSNLKKRTPERTAYLHSIGSDPSAIAQQKIVEGS